MIQSITYLVEAPVAPSGGRLSSPLARVRHRAILPSAALTRAGIMVRYHHLGGGVALSIPPGPEHVAVVSGVATPGILQLAGKVKANHNRLVVDLCEDHFDQPIGAELRALCNTAHQLVASTPALAARVQECTGCEAVVIADPCEGPAGEPLFQPGNGPLRLVWFGHATDFDTLVPLFQQLGAAMLLQPDSALGQRHVVMEIVCSPLPPPMQGLLAELVKQFQGRLNIVVTEWSEAATWQALQRAHILALPMLDDARLPARGASKLAEGIRAGRLVVAHPVPSYLDLADYAMIGDDIGVMIDQALRSSTVAISQRLAEGQAHVEQSWSPAAIGEQWRRVLAGESPAPAAAAVMAPVPTPQPAATPLIRLNLGCGQRPLPGFVNVDVVAAGSAARPDVACDLRQLTAFADNHADEITAIDVIPRFARAEVVAVLREWLRVLKPGARMVLECPDLLRVCEALRETPELANGAGPEGQRVMAALYGDPGSKAQPEHRWAYTPHSLAQVMMEAGLCNLREEAAQHVPHDMRIVGEKPAA